MPFLDIATAKLSLQNSLVPVCPQSFSHSQVLSGPWKVSQFHRRLRISHEEVRKQGTRLKIRAAATLEPQPSVWRENGSGDSDSESSLPSKVELNEKEKLRRMRISKANQGGTPWNKGKKLSEETRNLIRERTRLAMQDPKIRMKIKYNRRISQSEETKKKIGVGVRKGWIRRRARFMTQEGCYFEWQNLVAEASRKGQLGEGELQWDSFEVLNEQSKREWAESSEQRKVLAWLTGARRAPKSPEQRKKIAEAIAAKWADPAYRERVISARVKVWSRKKAEEKASGIGSTQPRSKSPSSDDNDSPNDSNFESFLSWVNNL